MSNNEIRADATLGETQTHMDSKFRLIAVLGGIVLLVALPAGRSVLTWCRRGPWRRPWFLASSVFILLVVGRLAPTIFDLQHPFPEPRIGLFLIVGRGLVLLIVSAAALGALVGTAWSYRRPPPSP